MDHVMRRTESISMANITNRQTNIQTNIVGNNYQYLYIYLCLSIHLLIYLTLSIYLSSYQYLPVSIEISLSISIHIYLSFCVFIYLSLSATYVYLYLPTSIFLPIHPSIYQQHTSCSYSYINCKNNYTASTDYCLVCQFKVTRVLVLRCALSTIAVMNLFAIWQRCLHLLH